MFENESENYFSSDTDFLHVKTSISLFPVDPDLLADEDREDFFRSARTFPYFMACGILWIPTTAEGFEPETVTFDKLDAWGTEDNEIFNVALENVDKRLSDATVTACCCIEKKDLIPFYRIGFDVDSDIPGSALILSQRVITNLHQHLGDFYAYPYERGCFYAISKHLIDRDGLSPYLTFRHISCFFDSVPRVPELSEKILLCGTDGTEVITPRVVIKRPGHSAGDGWQSY